MARMVPGRARRRGTGSATGGRRDRRLGAALDSSRRPGVVTIRPTRDEGDCRWRPATEHVHRLPTRGDPVPGRPRREQRPRLVHAAQGASTSDCSSSRSRRCASRSTSAFRARGIPLAGRSGPVAVPDLPRRPLLEGQVAVQDERRGVVPVDTATAQRAVAGGYFHFAPGEMYIGGGMWHPEPARLAPSGAPSSIDPASGPRGHRRPGVRRDVRRDRTATR